MSHSKRILFSLLALLLFFGGLEGILRIHDFAFYVNFNADLLGMPLLDLTRLRRVANRTVTFDRRVFWRFKPNQILLDREIYRRPVRINNLGFRGDDFSASKPAGVYRVLCLGDSTTFGWSVADPETYPYFLERLLRVRFPGRRFQVLNLGVTGYTSRQGRELFLSEADAFQPDLVLFAFGPNDRLPALLSDAEHLAAGDWQVSPLELGLARLQVYKLIRAGVVYLSRRSQGISLDPKTFIPLLKRKVSHTEFAENAAAVKSRCDELGADFILVNVDYPSQVMDSANARLREAAERAATALPKTWKRWNVPKVMEKIAGNLKVPWIDLRELFTREIGNARKAGVALPDPDWNYLMIDNGHPNSRGHQLIAEELFTPVESRPGFQRFLEKTR